MKNLIHSLFFAIISLSLMGSLFADTATVDVKIDSIDAKRRMVTVVYSGKSKELDVAIDAVIEIDGKKSRYDSLAAGDAATVTFDKKRLVITKIVAKRESMADEEGPFDGADTGSSQSNTKDDSASSGDGKVQTVIAEGVGGSADDAIKDAFRNAVRQVVGAVVDAETLIKNDELIDDQVLTYSDGFVKKFTEVEGSKKVSGGLHRIKIKADVERRSVIAKLKAARISVKEVDGKSMFAEVVSQLDAQKDAAAILTKQFEGFPLAYMKASVVGEPKSLDSNDKTAKIQVFVRIETDLEAYKAFASKLTSLLEKMAIGKGEFGAISTPTNQGLHFGSDAAIKWIPDIWKSSDDIFAIAVATSRNKLGDKFECKCYRLDPKLRYVILESLHRPYNIKLQFMDSEGESIDTVRLQSSGMNNNDGNRNAAQAISERNLVIAFNQVDYRQGLPIQEFIDEPRKNLGRRCRLAFIAPTFCQSNLLHYPAFNVPIITEVSLEELKSFKDIKVELYTD